MAVDSLPVEYLFTLRLEAAMDEAYHIRGGPAGRRFIAAVTGGTFDGPKIRGRVAPLTGGDWVTVRPDKSSRLDVRLVLLTDDDATIYMHYGGIATGSRLRTAPYFETGDGRYAWLNNVQTVGIGTVEPSGPVYDIYALE
jgi:hypothetical protein